MVGSSMQFFARAAFADTSAIHVRYWTSQCEQMPRGLFGASRG